MVNNLYITRPYFLGGIGKGVQRTIPQTGWYSTSEPIPVAPNWLPGIAQKNKIYVEMDNGNVLKLHVNV